MLKRLAPLLVALVLGLAALVWALLALHRTFVAERDEGVRAILAERRALAQHASHTARTSLSERLAVARAQVVPASRDPLVPATDVLRVRDGQQQLPRLTTPASTSEAQVIHGRLVAGTEAHPFTPWGERVSRLDALRVALAEGDKEPVEAAITALLTHRVRYRLRADRDLASVIAAVELLTGAQKATPELLQALLRDGVVLADDQVVDSLQRAALGARSKLTAADFGFVVTRIAALSRAANVAHADFLREADRPPVAALPQVPAVEAPSLVLAGRWLVAPAADGGVVGARVDLPAAAAALTGELRAGGLLVAGDRVAFEVPAAALPLARLEATVEGPRWMAGVADAGARYDVKTALIITCGVLAMAICGLAVAAQVRRWRFVEMRADFVAAVSHELRTPLASIQLMGETLERRLAGNADARDYPTRIVREAAELDFLIENILSFNRLDKERWQLRPVPNAADDVFAWLRDEVARNGAGDVVLETRAGPGAVVRADPELLKLLLSNLVRNAIKYTTRRPIRVTVVIESAAPGVRVSVSDNGPGIALGDQTRVFTEFFRADTGAATRGSGLGLAICRRITALHSGRIRIAASGEEGTTFAAWFPDGPDDETQEPTT